MTHALTNLQSAPSQPDGRARGTATTPESRTTVALPSGEFFMKTRKELAAEIDAGVSEAMSYAVSPVSVRLLGEYYRQAAIELALQLELANRELEELKKQHHERNH